MKWETVELDNVFSISKGKKHSETDDIVGSYKYITIEDLHRESLAKYTKEKGTEVIKNDLIIAWDGANAGKIGTGQMGMIGSTLARLRPKSANVNSRFLFWFLDSNFEKIKSQRTGATIPHVNGNSLRRFLIPLPPLHIQKQIADTLDKADALRRKDQQLLQKYDDLAQAIFYNMFGDPVKNEKGWEVKRIDECVIGKYGVKAGPFGSSLKKEFYVKSGYKIYGQEQVIADDFEHGDYYITEQKFKELESCKVAIGDVLISLVGTLGKVSIVPKTHQPGIINPRLVKITFNQNIVNPYFFKFFFQLPEAKKILNSVSRGGTMDIINAGILKEFKVPIPPLNTQQYFVSCHERITMSSSNLKNMNTQNLFANLLEKSFS